MYENDLYNINFDDEMDTEQTGDFENTEESARSADSAEPTDPANNAEPSTNQSTEAKPQNTQSSTQTKEQVSEQEYKITKEQHEYLEKARQKDELNQVVNDIKSRNPEFDFDLVAKKLLSMSEADQKKFYNPQGLELLWLREFAPNLAHNARVDVARNNASLDMDELVDKISKGTNTMDEELQFYLNLK